MHDHFGVATGSKLVAVGDQFVAQLDVVEDLAVEGDPQGAPLVGERLLPGGEVDDREPGVRQAGLAVAVEAELVGTAVTERAGHHRQLIELGRRRVGSSPHHAGDAAHISR